MDGTNDFLEIDDSPSLAFGNGDFAITAWVKKKAATISNSDNVALMGQWETGAYPGNNAWLFGIGRADEGNRLSFLAESGNTKYECMASETLELQTWYHLAVVRKNGIVMLYQNGEVVGQANWGDVDINDQAYPIYIGKLGVGFNTKMDIDNIQIYNRFLTPTEISVLYMGTQPNVITSNELLADLPLDGSGTDIAGNGYDATVTGATSVEDRNGNTASAFELDGTDDYLSIADAPAFNFENRDFTISFWVDKLEGTVSGSENIAGIGKWYSMADPGNHSWFISLGKSGQGNKPGIVVESGTEKYDYRSPNNLALNSWYQLTMVREGGEFKLYINGVYDGGFYLDPGTILNTIDAPVLIGRLSVEDYYTSAIFDDIQIYSYALNSNQIWQMYQGKTLEQIEEEATGTRIALTHYDYGFRIYNPAIARFLSVDPLTKSYPMLTPYQFASNRPIDGIDLDGLEFYKANHYTIKLNPKLFNAREVYASLYIDPYTQQVGYLQSAIKYEKEHGSSGNKTMVDGFKSLVSLGLEFRGDGISSSSNMGRMLGGISRVNALIGVYDEFKKAYDTGKKQGEELNYIIVNNLLTRDARQAKWVVEVIVKAQNKGLIERDKEYMEQLLNFSLKGDVPQVKTENTTFSFAPDNDLKNKLKEDFSILKKMVDDDMKKIKSLEQGDGKSKVIDQREISTQPRGSNMIKY